MLIVVSLVQLIWVRCSFGIGGTKSKVYVWRSHMSETMSVLCVFIFIYFWSVFSSLKMISTEFEFGLAIEEKGGT